MEFSKVDIRNAARDLEQSIAESGVKKVDHLRYFMEDGLPTFPHGDILDDRIATVNCVERRTVISYCFSREIPLEIILDDSYGCLASVKCTEHLPKFDGFDESITDGRNQLQERVYNDFSIESVKEALGYLSYLPLEVEEQPQEEE